MWELCWRIKHLIRSHMPVTSGFSFSVYLLLHVGTGLKSSLLRFSCKSPLGVRGYRRCSESPFWKPLNWTIMTFPFRFDLISSGHSSLLLMPDCLFPKKRDAYSVGWDKILLFISSVRPGKVMLSGIAKVYCLAAISTMKHSLLKPSWAP